eukprot:Blabericola_migrator_1__1962@NODE_1535_length_4328_cov_343_829148_g1009_i0_p1_GENE_NODE_1535_length_4328_cov_343_829148_g1009_i0NODE_1535_length_4328_cov_343_829148_g1009_i0_p1_ORF_typecomplete_len489_score79_50Integrin_beta/PF00362_18/1_2e08Integrin_beta/PF00362_18/0_96_NODE_1535_length_4328_cov_343_829148_g1009_i024653931
MIMYLFFTFLFAIASGDDTCLSSLEILHLQDTTGSFQQWLGVIKNYTDLLVAELEETFGEFKYAVAGFGDKPIPGRGWGDYSNFWGVDYCYQRATPLTTDSREITRGIEYLIENPTAGGDLPENPLEALIYGALDPNLGWSTATHSASGRPIRKIIMIVTDDLLQEAPNAAESISNYNAPRVWNEDLTWSTGGFGSFAYLNSNPPILTGDNHNDYLELAELYKYVDNDLEMTDAQRGRYADLVSTYGPASWPEPIAHPGDNSLPCVDTEYPTLEQTAKVIKEQNVLPILLLQRAYYADSAAFEWTQNYYREKLMALGIESPLIADPGTKAGQSTIAKIIDLLKLTQGACVSTTEAPAIGILTTSRLEDSAPVHPTALESTSGGIDEEDEEPTSGVYVAPPGQMDPRYTSTTVPPVAEPSSDTPTAKIVGATAGGFAAVAAVGVSVWKFVAALSKARANAGVESLGQVDAGEVTVDREAREEVSHQMFQ